MIIKSKNGTTNQVFQAFQNSKERAYAFKKIRERRKPTVFYDLFPEYQKEQRIKQTILQAMLRGKYFKSKHFNFNSKELRDHFKSKFRNGMTFANYTTHWEIDHIVPLCSVKACGKKADALWCLSNLQPLEIKLNQKKGKHY